MNTVYADLLDMLVEVRNADYRSDPERQTAMIDGMAFILQTMLEKLSRSESPHDLPKG